MLLAEECSAPLDDTGHVCELANNHPGLHKRGPFTWE